MSLAAMGLFIICCCCCGLCGKNVNTVFQMFPGKLRVHKWPTLLRNISLSVCEGKDESGYKNV